MRKEAASQHEEHGEHSPKPEQVGQQIYADLPDSYGRVS